MMLPANENYITLTSFRADWSDETIAENVSSYTLEVNTKPNYVLLEEADWSNVSESFSAQTANATNYFPSGWTFAGSDLWAEDGYISITNNASFSTPTYDLSGVDKITVVFTAKSSYPSVKFTVSTTVDSEEFNLTERTFVQYVAVLDCAAADHVTIANKSGNPGFLNMQIYAGEIGAPQLRIDETGDATYCTITGITDKFYTITGLTEGGTFLYKVKALYTDGTESQWSNTEEVTLVDNGPAPHEFAPGDLDHNNLINIKDVTLLINYLLTDDASTICLSCADVNSDNAISIKDVTDIINILLTAK
jgi:hypothetical protein